MREEIEDFQDEMEEILRNLHIDTAMSESAIAVVIKRKRRIRFANNLKEFENPASIVKFLLALTLVSVV